MAVFFSLDKVFPFLRWTRNVNRETLRADAIAGLTGAAIVLPQGVAFATIAGMPPEYGLYAGIVPAIVAALFGSSWHLVSGPTTAASIVMFSALSTLAIPGTPAYVQLAITLAFMVGAIQLIMGLSGLGTLVNFISHSVIVGFTAGVAISIVSRQLMPLLGLDVLLHEAGGDGLALHQQIEFLIDHWQSLHPLVSLVGLTTIVVAVLTKRKWPHIPGMIIAMLVGSLLAVALNATLEDTGVQMIGALPRQLPPLSTPDFSVATFKQLAPLALAMTVLALTEAVSISRSLALKSGQVIQGSQEFIGQGLANIAGSFFSAYVATGSFNRSSANYDAGAVTPLASVLAGGLLLLLIPLLAPLTAYLPTSAIAGLLIILAWRIIDFTHIQKILRTDRRETLILSITFFSTLFLELEFAILLGVLLSLVLYLRTTSRPRLLPRVPDPELAHRKFASGLQREECPQLKILRLDDSIYFGSVTHIRELFRLHREKYSKQKHLLLLTKGINQVDMSGAELLADETSQRRQMGGDFYMYRLKDSASKILKAGGYLDYIGDSNIFDSKEQAIKGIFDRLDKNICQHCRSRIFVECQSVPAPPSDDADAPAASASPTEQPELPPPPAPAGDGPGNAGREAG